MACRTGNRVWRNKVSTLRAVTEGKMGWDNGQLKCIRV